MEGERKTVREKYSSYKDIKIAVYNIMRDEGKFLEGWLENVKDADYICLLDTGSTDGSYERALVYADQHPEFKGTPMVEQAIINPWRFDEARNRNLEMVPDDDKVDIIYSIDLDERVEDGFFEEVRKVAWENPRAPQFCYLYCWGHDNETKEPTTTFWYNKMSYWMKGEIYYKFDVHEAWFATPKYYEFYTGKSARLRADKIWLHHWPDQTKSRGSYLGLLEQRVKHYPDDQYGKFYLFREKSFYGMAKEGLLDALSLYNELLKENDDMLMLPTTAMMIARFYEKMPQKEKEVEFFYKRAIEADPGYRDAYFFYAKWLAYQGRSVDALDILKEGKTKSYRHWDWRESGVVWSHWFEAQIRGVAYCWLGEYELAYQTFKRAAETLTETEKHDAAEYWFFGDYNWVKNKLGIKE